MKKIQIIITSFLIILYFSCSENTTAPDESKGILLVQNEVVDPGKIIQLNDYPLFVLNYSGDYGFSSYIKKGSPNKFHSNNFSNSEKKWGCTCFSAMAESCKVFGRNFDYYHHIALILFTHPPNAYSSISVADISYLGFSESTALEEIEHSSSLSRSPYCTIDGLNEKGVAIGLMLVPFADPPFDPKKKDLACCDIIRLVLDYASSTTDAVNLISQYNFKDEDYPTHYLIADKAGNSAVIEFVNKELKVTWNEEPFLVSTNFIITGSSAPESTPCWRYNRVYNALKNANGNIDQNTAMNILKSASQNITMWSSAYDMNSYSFHICVDKNYDKTYSIRVLNKQ